MIWHFHTDYSKLHPYLWILMCLPWIVWEVEEWNGADFGLLHFPAIWLGFWKYFCKDQPLLYFSIGSLMSLIVYIYPYQGIACFHPTSKDGLCETRACTCVTYIAKSNKGSMEMTNHTSWSRLCTCVEGGWWNAILLLWISLSFIWITWGHGYICIYFFLNLSLFFSWTLMCPFFSLLFFGSCFLGMPSFPFFLFFFFFFFWIAHASFEGYYRERSLNMEFYFVDEWNGIANS